MLQAIMCGVAHIHHAGGLDSLRQIAEVTLAMARVRGSVVSFAEGKHLAVTAVGDGHILHLSTVMGQDEVVFHGSGLLVHALAQSEEFSDTAVGYASDRFQTLAKGA